MSATPTTRRPDIDNLRTAATLLLIPFHTWKVFDDQPFYHLKDERPIDGLQVLTSFIHQWHMPLFFVLAGWSTAAALGRRSAAEYRSERTQKLLVPLLLGSALLGPFLRWVELVRIDGVHESFGEFLPSFFTDLDRFSWSHLWFLAYLYVLSQALLPLFRKLHARTEPLQLDGRHLAGFVGLLVVVQLSLRALWPGFQNLYDDWANVTYYGLFLSAGFLLGRFPEVDELLERHGRRLAQIGAVAAAAMVPFWLRWIERPDGEVLPYVAYYALSALAGAGLVTAALRLGHRRLAGDGAVHRWGRSRAFPIYVLHQTAVVVVAVHLVDRKVASWPAMAAVLVGSSALTLVATEALTRVRLLRPLFGASWRRPGRSSGQVEGAVVGEPHVGVVRDLPGVPVRVVEDA